FISRFAAAARSGGLDAFRRYCDSLDLWLVDDFQFLAANEQGREEFYFLFYRLYQQGRQIVIASDRSPQDFAGLEERVRTRFEAGLIVDVGSPGLETRMSILERRCRREGWQAPREGLYLVANGIRSHVRTAGRWVVK